MNVRKLALDAIEKIIVKKAFANICVNEFLSTYELSKEDRALFTNIVYGTVQYLITIEYYLEPFVRKKQKPWVRFLLDMSVYQLVYLDIPEYAVVSEAVNIANMKDRQLGNFVNAVLRNFLRTPLRKFRGLNEIDLFSYKYSHPRWLVAFLMKDYDNETVEKILIENGKVKDVAIRVNTLKITKEEVKKIFERDGINYQDTDLVKNGLIVFDNITQHELVKKGKVVIQGISSQMVAEVCNPKENSNILDLCSAPGGKVSHLSALTNNTGSIYACDIYPQKIKLMEKAFKKQGITNVKPQQIDARNVKNYVKERSFDYVLADAPCSGLGVLSHRVDLKYTVTKESIEEVTYLQEEILESTYKLVKSGGYYIYSTCTINKDENERQIAKFLRRHDEFVKEEERIILPFENHIDGFYICKMRRL